MIRSTDLLDGFFWTFMAFIIAMILYSAYIEGPICAPGMNLNFLTASSSL